MHPVTHFSAGWTVAGASGLGKRDRAIVSIAGIAPDFDGAGIVVELATRESNAPINCLWTHSGNGLAHRSHHTAN
jgi:hypothetical protein